MTYFEKLIEKVEMGNKGIVIKGVGLKAPDSNGNQEIIVVKTSRNANINKLMRKHGLTELYLEGVYYHLFKGEEGTVVMGWSGEESFSVPEKHSKKEELITTS